MTKMAAYAFQNLIITYYSKMLRQIQSQSDITAPLRIRLSKFEQFFFQKLNITVVMVDSNPKNDKFTKLYFDEKLTYPVISAQTSSIR